MFKASFKDIYEYAFSALFAISVLMVYEIVSKKGLK